MKKLNSSFKKTLLASLVVPFALGAASVSAGTLITDWSYAVDSEFSDAAFTTGTGTQDTSDENVISWGGVGEANRSSISITDAASTGDLASKLKTNGAAVEAGVFTHDNNTISSEFATLESFKLTSTLSLTPFLPSVGPSETLPSITFNSLFTETLNDPGPGGTCADGLAAPCGDIFTLVGIEDISSIVDGVFLLTPQQFTLDGYIYSVFLELAGLGELPSEACAAAGSTSTECYGLLTPEGQLNTFQSSFKITAVKVPVPEPGTLALLGLGIAGLSLSRRKQAAKS